MKKDAKIRSPRRTVKLADRTTRTKESNNGSNDQGAKTQRPRRSSRCGVMPGPGYACLQTHVASIPTSDKVQYFLVCM